MKFILNGTIAGKREEEIETGRRRVGIQREETKTLGEKEELFLRWERVTARAQLKAGGGFIEGLVCPATRQGPFHPCQI